MAPKTIDRQLMLDYLQGNCNAAQLHRIQEYLQNEAYRESLDKFLLEEWHTLSSQEQPPMPGLEQQYLKFRDYLSQRQQAPAQVRRLPVIRPARLAGIAAIFVVVVLSAWWLLSRQSSGKSGATAAQWIVVHTQPGQRNSLVLPDSSIVYLGTASTIQYNIGYNNDNRRILLQGEAYFVVKHGRPQPFTVVTGNISTVDIGTEFNIRYYPGKTSVEVAVAKGKVEVRSRRGGGDARIAAIGQGELLQYDSLTDKIRTTVLADAGLAGAWRKGILSFRRQPLKEVTDELERYYGVHIHYTNPVHENILITTLLNNNSLEDALDIVTVTAGIHYAREGNNILLK